MARPSNSWVWEFYNRQQKETGTDHVECKFCHKTIKYTSRNGPTNLSKHLIRMHGIESNYLFGKKLINDEEKLNETDDEHHLSSILNDLTGSNIDTTNLYNVKSDDTHMKNSYYEVPQDVEGDNKSNAKDSQCRVESINVSSSKDYLTEKINLLPIYRLKVKRNNKVSKPQRQNHKSISNADSTPSKSFITRLHNYESVFKELVSTRKDIVSNNETDKNTIAQLNDTIDKLVGLISTIFQEMKEVDSETTA